MRVASIAVVLTMASGCASSERLADAPAAGVQHHPAATVDPSNVRTVAIESFANEPVCTRRAPTGSRIAVERCTTRDPSDALEAAAHNQAREDLDEMRRRQIYQEQARQQALMRGRF